MFARLPDALAPRDGEVRVVVDGETCTALPHDSVAAVLLRNGRIAVRRSALTASERGPYCMMGACFDCRVTIDGMPDVQACMTRVRDGMRIATTLSAPDAQPLRDPIPASGARPLDEFCDVAVIGAGPAGLAASIAAARGGLSVALIDEQSAPGGQIYRAVTTTPLPRGRIGDDSEHRHGAQLIDTMIATTGVRYLPETLVWAVDNRPDGFELAVSSNGCARRIRARRLVVATGAIERPVPIPGWTLPGVMTVGAAQILLKTSGIVPTGRTIVAGSGPLLMRVAGQLLRAGARIDWLLDTTLPPRSHERWGERFVEALDFARSPYAWRGLALLREARGVARVDRVSALSAIGSDRLRAVRYTRGKESRELHADLLLVHQGVVPNLNLPSALGCAIAWQEANRCFAPVVDAWGASSLDRIAIAGDAAGIGGARAAEARGILAGLAAAHALGALDAAHRDREAAVARRMQKRWLHGRRFIDTRYAPAPAFRTPLRGALVCRCEEVTADTIAAAARAGACGPNQVKSFVRCGMGPCQGRLCGLTVAEIIAAERGMSLPETGYYRLRYPVKPVTLAELAALDNAVDPSPAS